MRGGAMPSTHTAVTVVFMWFVRLAHPKVFWVYFPFGILLMVGTVWGRFHYVTDTVLGAGIALFCIWLSSKFEPKASGARVV